MRLPDAGRTVALVVGVERYGIPGWDLPGPAADAVRFVRWLRSHDVPAAHIRLHLAPLDDGVDEGLDVEVRGAGRAEIEAAFDHWLPEQARQVPGGLLIVFWGGHGVIDDHQKRHLFCADATELAPYTIDLQARLRQLRSEHMAGLAHQVGIVDACANYFEEIGARVELEGGRAHAGSSDPAIRQFVLLSAAAGERALNDSVRKTGEFSRVVLDALEEGGWPPALEEATARVRAHFDKLSGTGRTRQTPLYLEWGGPHFDSGHLGAVPASRRVQESARSTGASVAQYRRLAESLSAVPELRDPAVRERLVGLLPAGVRERVPAEPADPACPLLELAAAAFEHDGGASLEAALEGVRATHLWLLQDRLQSLRTLVELRALLETRPVGTDRLRQLYFRSVPHLQRARSAGDLDDILEELWEMSPRVVGGLHPLYEFAERVAREQDWAELRAWVEEGVDSQQRLQDLRQELDREEHEAPPVSHLVVDAAPSPDTGLRYWLYVGETEFVRHGRAACPSTAPEGIRSALLALVSEVEAQVEGELFVELFVPYEQLHWEAEELEQELFGGTAVPLGDLHPVLLRWRERAEGSSRARPGPWRKRARRIREDPHLSGQPRADWLDPDADGVRLAADGAGTCACVGFRFVPRPGSAPPDGVFLGALLGGAPFAVWSRCEEADWQAFSDRVDPVLLLGPIGGFPLRARDRLRKGGDGPACRVALLWDDPCRNHLDQPFQPLSQREA